MASYTITQSKHATLSGSVVDDVTINVGVAWFSIQNRSTTDGIYYTFNEGSAPANPSVNGDGTYFLAPGAIDVYESPNAEATTIIKLISSGAAPYSIEVRQ